MLSSTAKLPAAIIFLICTDIRLTHFLYMVATLSLAVIIPYWVSRIYRDNVISFPLHHGRRWYRSEIGYIFFTSALAYALLPIYFQTTGAYLHWPVLPGVGSLFMLFIGTMLLGAWDELFFVATTLATFQRYLPFVWANIAQAVLWTAFLYALGFTGWAPLALFPFALLQGYIFNRTHSLLYVLTIHLTLDVFLYLALLNAYHHDWLPIFIT
jgi:membrane protease YdiL (CAAX protease family)